ncbi:glycerol transport system ATP-binding protein [Cupriavidus gilardii CR3]|uniref:ABC transporter ATP-binding protein n=1 Tax=Cupriavidus gilardii TaxID=82541 RepID=A0A849B8T5_9BURK|nr:ABC transporter ATP-binding protein [Cupriavidus gilardii]ALD91007.1 glycerol transport system ATP-binding protein [Cupriavidus gilardii CR3]KAB0596284.1 ABC transporter ATP-binding protein [Cupriavidus gilardii]MCT9012178.1 ABC transporter ATP-binding protein [Cupriavidus gilardii]MCT9053685.1 ABC transporter ATP-binding protein [Cupriavidus gilardii]NNH11752.1 ABC transporter ATP-binding protein [Cupriavidus gilardii]
MQLRLEGIAQQAGSQVHLYPMSLAPVPGAVTILLGATQAGKTSLMRVMAGLDRPSAGRVLVDDADVTGMPVRQRNVSMVYQQFINYPSLTVFDNIASPLRLRGADEIDRHVRALAARLHIDHLLERHPAELSGGQQQRVALARALAKGAPLMLLDEPLVNLDYKLREELRDELAQLFAQGDATVIYATTEPGEALLLGGHTAVLDAGELLQYGPTAEVFHYPDSLRVARAFSDPPMNLIAGEWRDGAVHLPDGIEVALRPDDSAIDSAIGSAIAGARDALQGYAGPATVGVRAGTLWLDGVSDRHDELAVGVPRAREGVPLPGRVALAELSGSDTFVHVDTAVGNLVAQVPGVLELALGETVTLRLDPSQLYLFDAQGRCIRAPRRVHLRPANRQGN